MLSQLGENPLAINIDSDDVSVRPKMLEELFTTTTSILMIRDAAVDALIGLADLDLPALLLVEILDNVFLNSVPMHKKWDLVTAVKHWRQRHGQ